MSNSTLHGSGYLEYAKEHICEFLHSHKITKVTMQFLFAILCEYLGISNQIPTGWKNYVMHKDL